MTVTPGVTPEGEKIATLKVCSEAGEGQVTSPWNGFFYREHLVVTTAPTGYRPKPAKRIRRSVSKQERKFAESIGGRAHAGSGALAGNKSDGSSETWRVENKSTTFSSFSVKLPDLQKIRSECRGFQQPVFNVDFVDKHTRELRESWVLVPAAAWRKLVNATDDHR